ncbi:MAG TPA: flavodoxin domain-containing protein [Rariglobus sp.]|nr:flavodoxin domain-containing protein [Rariglobus sp.]
MKNTPTPAFFYATETGNAETLARQAHERAVAEGRDTATVANLSQLRPADLTAHSLALFVVSTWGDGEPPSDATDFFYDLEKAPLDLSGLRYAVLGLGDRDYSDFCGFARKLDERLADLGAKPLLERAEADLDYEDAYNDWIDRILPLLDENAVPAS